MIAGPIQAFYSPYQGIPDSVFGDFSNRQASLPIEQERDLLRSHPAVERKIVLQFLKQLRSFPERVPQGNDARLQGGKKSRKPDLLRRTLLGQNLSGKLIHEKGERRGV